MRAPLLPSNWPGRQAAPVRATLAGSGMETVLAVADFFFCPDEESRNLWLKALERIGELCLKRISL
jgi:hypothetical protein